MQIDEKALEDASRAYCDVIRLNYEGLSAQLVAKRDEAMRAAILAYESAKQKGEAEGWVLVPREPMPEMLGAFWRVKIGHQFHDEPEPTDRSDYAAYRAMLAAAPEPPTMLSAGGEG